MVVIGPDVEHTLAIVTEEVFEGYAMHPGIGRSLLIDIDVRVGDLHKMLGPTAPWVSGGYQPQAVFVTCRPRRN